MSWVFLAGDRVYKLKKPVRFPYLDFSTLRGARPPAGLSSAQSSARTGNLSRRVASDSTPHGLAIGGTENRRLARGHATSRRAPDARTVIAERRVAACSSIVWSRRWRNFIAGDASYLVASDPLADWSKSLAYNRRVLLDPRFGLPPA